MESRFWARLFMADRSEHLVNRCATVTETAWHSGSSETLSLPYLGQLS